MRLTTGLYIIIFILFYSCAESPKNEDSRINESLVISKSNEADRNYIIDSARSFISWTGSNSLISHYGIFHIDHGFLSMKDSAVAGGEIYISLKNIKILDLRDNPDESNRLSAFMASKSFFDVQKFPIAKFEIDSLKPINISVEERVKSTKNISDYPTDSVYGKLTIKGITKTIKFPAKIDLRYFSIQSSATFNINRHLWNLLSQGYDAGTENDGELPDSMQVGFDIIANAK